MYIFIVLYYIHIYKYVYIPDSAAGDEVAEVVDGRVVGISIMSVIAIKIYF